MSDNIVSLGFKVEKTNTVEHSFDWTDSDFIEDIILQLAVAFDQLSLVVGNSELSSIIPRIQELIDLTHQAGFFEQTKLLEELITTIQHGDDVAAYAILARLDRRSETDCLAALSALAVSRQ